MPDMRARKQRLIEFIQEVWNTGSEAAVERYVASSYTVRHDPGDPWDGQTLDHDGFRARLRSSRAPFPDQRFDVQRLCTDDDAVVMTWLWQGTHRGDLPDFPATQQVVYMSGATAYFFDAEDLLVGHWQVADRLGVFQQLLHHRADQQGSTGSHGETDGQEA